MVSEDVRPVLGSSARQKMADLGRATGEPYSSERKAQLIELWDQNLADLHIAIPHEASSKAKWLDHFMKLQTGQLYCMQVLSQLEPDKYQAELLRRFRPEWAKDDFWMNNKGDREKAIMRCGLWFEKRLPDGQAKLQHRLFPDEFRSASELQGAIVGIGSGGRFLIRWKRSDGMQHALRLNSLIAVPSFGYESRALSFTQHGIDIVDAHGSPIRMSQKLATIPKAHFHGSQNGPLVTEMWKEVLVSLGKDPGPDIQPAIKWSSEKGVDRIPRQAKIEKPRQNRPPQLMDANWLLNPLPR